MRQETKDTIAGWVARIIAIIGYTILFINMIGLVIMVFYSIYRVIFK